MAIEWHEFLPGEGPEVLTGTSRRCTEGEHLHCRGIFKVSVKDDIDDTCICICPCHKKPGNT
jgi:hypothetical protein